MALLVTECALCKGKISPELPCLTTWGVPFPESHRLFKYCDAGFHQECLLSWPDCAEYAAAYFEMWRSSHAQAKHGAILAGGVDWHVGCGPFYKASEKVNWPFYVQLVPKFFPIRLKCDWAKWESFIAGEWTKGLMPEVVRHLENVVHVARVALPNVSALEAATGRTFG